MSDEDQSAPPSLTNAPADLRGLTLARVGLDRTGASITTRHALEFSLAHAQARDAVHAALAVPSLLAELHMRNLAAVAVRSAVHDRTEYLLRPDLGRTLAPASARLLQPTARGQESATILTLILADGLSALATERHALHVVDALLPLLDVTCRLTPIVVAEQARVALGDSIGDALRSDATLMLIGERPGLSSPDSLGAYITWSPRLGRTDAERNCVSNIRIEGLEYAAAAHKIAWLLAEARRLGLSGVALRESGSALLP
ncbi:MAG TPA: ethanolamine ammonia-lyase subunit EutC [Acidobacteriaceae bacterium]|jgi:ethanolamine ammonia-lyase small subunit